MTETTNDEGTQSQWQQTSEERNRRMFWNSSGGTLPKLPVWMLRSESTLPWVICKTNHICKSIHKRLLRSQVVKGRQSKGMWKHKCDWNKLSDTLSANHDPHLLLHYCSYKDAPPTTLLGGTEEKYQWQPDCGAAQTPGVSIWEACRKASWWRLHGGQLWHPAPF